MASNVRLLSFSVLVACAHGACGDDAPPSTDSQNSVSCVELNESECEQRNIDHVDAEHACHRINGRKLCDRLADEESPSFEFVTCAEGGDGDATVPTCASDPETGDAYTFPSTDIPAEWIETKCDEALDSCEMGSGGGGGGASANSCAAPKVLHLLENTAPMGGAFSQPRIELGQTQSGLVECAGARVDRVADTSCGAPLPIHLYFNCGADVHTPIPEICEGDEYLLYQDCEGSECYVDVGCQNAVDCDEGEVCACAAGPTSNAFFNVTNPVSRCVPAECESASDCGAFACGGSTRCGEIRGFFCRTAEDECSTNEDCDDSDCPAGTACDGECMYHPTLGRWACQTSYCDD